MSITTPVLPGARSAPQVNLLPPEIRASRALRSTKRLLLISLIGVLALAVAGWGASMMQVSAAEAELQREQDETRRLLAEQQQYSEVPAVLGALDSARTARQLGTSTEVFWDEYLLLLMLTAPADVTFSSIAVSGATPMQPPPAPSHPLQSQSTFRLDFSGGSATLPDTAAWMDALEGIEEFQDAQVFSMSITEGTTPPWEGRSYYEVTGSVQITSEALANRFADEEEG